MNIDKNSIIGKLTKTEKGIDFLHEQRIILQVDRFLDDSIKSELLRNKVNQVKIQQLAWISEFKRVNQILQKRNISFVNIKGPALSLLLYDNLVQRQYRDLDVLCESLEDLKNAINSLKSIGYQPLHPYFENKLELFFGYEKHFNLFKPGSPFVIELHLKLFNTGNLSKSQEVFKQKINLEWDDLIVPTLSTELYEQYLAIHGEGHFWLRLHWLLDFHYLKTKIRNEKANGWADQLFNFYFQNGRSDNLVRLHNEYLKSTHPLKKRIIHHKMRANKNGSMSTFLSLISSFFQPTISTVEKMRTENQLKLRAMHPILKTARLLKLI